MWKEPQTEKGHIVEPKRRCGPIGTESSQDSLVMRKACSMKQERLLNMLYLYQDLTRCWLTVLIKRSLNIHQLHQPRMSAGLLEMEAYMHEQNDQGHTSALSVRSELLPVGTDKPRLHVVCHYR